MFRLSLNRIATCHRWRASLSSLSTLKTVSKVSTCTSQAVLNPIECSYLSPSPPATLQPRYMSTNPAQIETSGESPKPQSSELMGDLDRSFSRFEAKCSANDHVAEREFIRIFDLMTTAFEKSESNSAIADPDKLKDSISRYSITLLKCCGRFMFNSDTKTRELLAGNLWTFLKEKKIPIEMHHYNALVRTLNENKTNYDPQKILQEIEQSNLVPDRITYQRLIHQYCLQGDIEGATNLLGIMRNLSMELNEIIFASLIIGYSKQESPPAFTEMFELMRSNGIEPNGPAYTAAIISNAGALARDPTATSELEKVFELILKESISFSVNEKYDIIETLAPLRSIAIVGKIFEHFLEIAIGSNLNDLVRFMSYLIKAGATDISSKTFWSLETSDRGRNTGNLGIFYIKTLVAHKDTPIQHVVGECSKLRQTGRNSRAFHHLFFYAAEYGRLDLVRASLKAIKEREDLKVNYIYPLIAQAKDKQEVIDTLKNDLGFEVKEHELIDLFTAWVWPKFFDDPKMLFTANKGLKFDVDILIASYFNYSVSQDRAMDAVNFISSTSDDLLNQRSYRDSGRQQHSQLKNRLLGDLLLQVAEKTKDVALVNKIFEITRNSRPNSGRINADALVKVCLLNDDADGALEACLKINQEYGVIPCKSELIEYLLKTDDQVRLRRIMAVCKEKFGINNALFDLAVCCFEVGRLEQAEKIIRSRNLIVRPDRVYDCCYRLAHPSRDLATLEHFVRVTRNLPDVNPNLLYEILKKASSNK